MKYFDCEKLKIGAPLIAAGIFVSHQWPALFVLGWLFALYAFLYFVFPIPYINSVRAEMTPQRQQAYRDRVLKESARRMPWYSSPFTWMAATIFVVVVSYRLLG